MKRIKAVLFFIVIAAAVFLPFAFATNNIELSECEKGIFVIKLNTQSGNICLKPYVAQELETNREVFESTNAKLVINGGFFDPKNKKTVSHITIDSKSAANPDENENLTSNPALKPYLPQIFNRYEFRILDCGGKIKYDITAYDTPVNRFCFIKHSIQAGPKLLPEPALEEEFFILQKEGKVVRDSISALSKTARTAVGIKGKDVYLIIVTNQNPVTIAQLSDFCKKLSLDKAVAFDGGGSTSLNYGDFEITSEKNSSARKLKSFLLVESSERH